MEKLKKIQVEAASEKAAMVLDRYLNSLNTIDFEESIFIENLKNEVFGADLNPVDDSFNLIIETDLRICKVSYEISTYRYN